MAHGVSPYSALPYVTGLSFANVFTPAATANVGYLPLWPMLLGGIYDVYSALCTSNQFVYYFLLKQPAIVGDVALGYAIYRYVMRRRPSSAGWALGAWLLSPFTVVVSSIWGTFDSLAALFVVFALLAKGGGARSALVGMATLVKSVPVIYSLPMAFSSKRGPVNLAIALAVPVAFSAGALYLSGWPIPRAAAAITSTVPKGGESLSIWDGVFYLNSLGVISNSAIGMARYLGYVWVPAALAATYLSHRWFGFDGEKGILQSTILITLSFLLFRAQVNEQYAIYLLAPALIDVAIWHPQRKRLFVAITAVVLLYTVVNNPLLVRFAAPGFPGALYEDSWLVTVTGGYRFAAKFAIGLVFTALCLLYAKRLVSGRDATRAVTPG